MKIHWKKVLGLGTIVMMAMAMAAPLAVDAYYTGRVESMIAAYHKAGEPIELKDFDRDAIPDSENAAVGILPIAKAVSGLSTEEGKATDILLETYPPTEEELKAARIIVAKTIPSEHLLDQLLERREVHWLNTSVGQLAGTEHLDGLRGIVNLLKVDARIAVMEGDTKRAVRRTKQILRISAIVGSDASMIGSLVSTGIEALGCSVVTDTLPAVMREDAASLIPLLLDDASHDARIVQSLKLERGNTLAQVDSFTSSLPTLKALVTRPMMNRDVPTIMKMIDLSSKASLEQDVGRRKAIISEINTLKGQCGLVGSLFAASYDRFSLTCTHIRADRRIAAVILAARAYKTDHGVLPTKLDELVPAYLPFIPVDPFSNAKEPLKYNAATGLIYSVGENGLDDGGVVDPIDSRKSLDMGANATVPPPTSRPLPSRALDPNDNAAF